jgi:hypothetical protein
MARGTEQFKANCRPEVHRHDSSEAGVHPEIGVHLLSSAANNNLGRLSRRTALSDNWPLMNSDQHGSIDGLTQRVPGVCPAISWTFH